jgi:hypothetical protein
MNTEFPGFPCQIKWVDGNAVAAEAGTGVEGGKAEGFGGCGAYDLPDVDTHLIGCDFEFVDQADVDCAIYVFEKFGQFRNLSGGHGYNCFEGSAVEGDSGFEAGGCVTADDFGDIGCGELGIAWILAFGRVNNEDVGAGFESSFFHSRDHFLFGGSRVGGAFEAQNLSRLEIWHDGFQGIDHITEIWLEVLIEWSWDAEDDGVTAFDAREVSSGVEFSRGACFGDLV